MARPPTEFVRGLGLFDAAMVVAGSMIGSGIFIVSADMARQLGAPGWLLVAWLVTGLLTLAASLSYGELAAMFPHAGGQYVFLREAYSPLWAFLYGWTFFLVIQCGTIAAVAVGFAKYTGVLVPAISESRYLVPPIHLSSRYALSLSTAQLFGIASVVLLTFLNTRGLSLAKWIQNVFTVTKTAALVLLILLGLTVGYAARVAGANFGDLWSARGALQDVGDGLTAASAFGLFVALCVSQTNSLFSADAWHNVAFTAAEVKDPRRNLPLALALGTGFVLVLYLLANLAYLVSLPFWVIQTVPMDRVGSAAAAAIFPGFGATLMAVAIVISTFGCNNGLILAGARAYWAMAKDGLFFRQAGELNRHAVPAWGLWLQCAWSSALVLPRVVAGVDPATGVATYRSLYNDLLAYVISAALVFYILTIAGLFRLRRIAPDVPRPYRALGYPLVPLLYLAGATTILVTLFVYQPAVTWPGLAIVATGFPVYGLWQRRRAGRTAPDPAPPEADAAAPD